jgi:hypothetical protein
MLTFYLYESDVFYPFGKLCCITSLGVTSVIWLFPIYNYGTLEVAHFHFWVVLVLF